MPETVEVAFNTGFAPASNSRKKTCVACGGELDDARKTYHDACKPEAPPKTGGRVRNKGKTKAPTEAVSRGMNSITGKLLYLLTLFIAWSMLRGVGVPDQNGDMADSMALTDDEAAAIGKPLTRLFLTTEQGKSLAPKLVDNEDLIDAAFALWDWYRRMTSTMDQIRAEMIPSNNPADVPPPIRFSERRNTNGNNGKATPDREPSEVATDADGNPVGYVPPSAIDLLGA